jgi:hypothetical protein
MAIFIKYHQVPRRQHCPLGASNAGIERRVAELMAQHPELLDQPVSA